MDDLKETHFSTHLTHQFNLVDQQVQAGLYVVKRTSVYLKKIITTHLEAAAALEKITKNEGTKVSALQKDGMQAHVAAVVQLQSVFGSIIQKHKDFSAKVTKEVVDPLLEFFKTGDKKREAICKKEAKLRDSLQKVYNKLKTQRVTAQKKWDEIQKMSQSMQGVEPMSAKHAKMEKDLKKALDQGAVAFKTYEVYTDESFVAGQTFFVTDMPHLLDEMEAIEKERLVLLKQLLHRFAQLYNEWDQPSAPGKTYKELVDQLDLGKDMHKCIVDRVSEVGLPSGPPELPPPLPCKSSDFSTEEWRNPKPPPQRQFEFKKPGGGVAVQPKEVKSEVSSALAPLEHKDDEKEPTAGGLSGDVSSAIAGEEPGAAGGGYESSEVQYCRGVYEYNTDHSDDLQFKVGEVIKLLTPNVDFASHDPSNPVWLLGELVANPEKSGSFPSNYVEACDAEGRPIST